MYGLRDGDLGWMCHESDLIRRTLLEIPKKKRPSFSATVSSILILDIKQYHLSHQHFAAPFSADPKPPPSAMS